MKIISCLKPVPDGAARLVLNDSRTWIKTQDLSYNASEGDSYALEEALRLKEKHGGEVVVMSIGGEEAARVLRSGLAMGADRAIHLVDDAFKGGDEYATAALLAAAIQKDGGADLVLTGVQSDDLGSGTTGVMLAECLSCAHATVVVGVDVDSAAGTVEARRELEGGMNESVRFTMPGVLTVQYGINQPRYASLKGIMAAKKKEMKVWTSADFPGLLTGAAAAMYEVRELFVPERKSRVEMISGSPEEMVARLIEKLRKEAKVL